MSLIAFLVVGLIAGLIARAIYPGSQAMGLVATTLLGAFANNDLGRPATAFVGMARTTISPAWAASTTETGIAPISAGITG